jgi:uncharacterized Zn-binding protein involved in type VI secretion/phosphoribosyl-AMP cyclohydrolase
MPPAARVSDPHQCNLSNSAETHEGGPVDAPGSPTVRTAFRAQARAGDACRCLGPPDFVVTGAATVLVDGRPAARKGDRTMHQPAGTILGGVESVDIGGPTAGVVLGGVDAGGDACYGAASGRASGDTRQSYGNCAVESTRQLLNRAMRTRLTEDELLRDALLHGDAQRHPEPMHLGGMTVPQQVRLAERHGLVMRERPATLEGLAQAVAERRGVITSHEVSVLWGNGQTGGHAIVVTGVRYDADGNPSTVVFNDTGSGECSNELPVAHFMASLRHGFPMTVTERPVW